MRACLCLEGVKWECVLEISSTFLRVALDYHTVWKGGKRHRGTKHKTDRKFLMFSSEIRKYSREKEGEFEEEGR